MGALRRCRWVLWAVVALALGACTLLTQPAKEQLPCAVADAADDDPCPKGLKCIEGECQKAVQQEPEDPCADGPNEEEEICNSLDDNCDGDVDEGHDKDGDGVTWCAGGLSETKDCDDHDPHTYPGAQEVCDGRDNDCDGEIDEAPTRGSLCEDEGTACLEQRCVVPNCLHEGTPVTCPDGTRCAPSGECVRGDGCEEGSCAQDEVCDKASGTCVGLAKSNGDPCSSHDECASGNCTDTASLRMRSPYERVCGKSCCADVNCPEGEFCFASGTGARSCLPVGWDPRSASAEPVCSGSSECGEDLACTLKSGQEIRADSFRTRTDLATTVCSMPEGDVRPGYFCRSNEACLSGICEPNVFSYCSLPCGSSKECEEQFDVAIYCRTKTHGVGFLPGLDFDFVSVCVEPAAGQGDGGQGATCDASSECADAACVRVPNSSRGFCASACCNDTQCLEGTACRALAFGDHYEMRCVP